MQPRQAVHLAIWQGQFLMRLGKARVVLFAVLGMLLVAIVAAGVGYRVWANRCEAEFQAAIGEIRSRGEPVWFSELAPKDHPEWDEAGRRLDEILSRLQPLSEEFNRAFNGVGPPEPDNYSALATALVENRDVIDEVVDLARTKTCRHRYDFGDPDPLVILLDHVSGIRAITKLLAAEHRQCLAAGDEATALDVLTASFEITDLLVHDPIFVSQLVRAAVGNEALNSLEAHLSTFSLRDEPLRQLDERLSRCEASFRLTDAMLCERATALTSMRTAVQKGGRLLRDRSGRDMAFYARQMAVFLPMVDSTGPTYRHEVQRLVKATDDQIEADRLKFTLAAVFFPNLNKIHAAGLEYRQRLINARLALRVCSHRDVQGSLPMSLADVVDETLPAVPIGYFSGAPVRYNVEADGFSIYDEDPLEPGEDRGLFAVAY